MKLTINIEGLADVVAKHKKEIEEMKEKEIIDIKKIYEMGVQVGMEFASVIQNMKVE